MTTFPYVPLDAKGWRLAMGLRPLADDAWLERDERRDSDLAEKARLVAEERDQVVVLAGCDDAAVELRDALRDWCGHHWPSENWEEHDDHPLVAAAQCVQEDLVLLEKRDTWRLTGAVVCFPSRWDLPSKAGATLDAIHDPVPGYADALAAPTNALFERLTPERSFWRLNWTLLDDETLFQPRSRRRAPQGDWNEWFVRVERQTLRRLPRTGAIVFTIRTYVTSVADLVGRDPAFVETLVANIETAPSAMQEYKGWRGVADYLRSLA